MEVRKAQELFFFSIGVGILSDNQHNTGIAKMQHLFDFLSLNFVQRQSNGHHGAAALSVADGQRAAVTAHDLVANGKADAAAAGLGGPFIKFLLDKSIH